MTQESGGAEVWRFRSLIENDSEAGGDGRRATTTMEPVFDVKAFTEDVSNVALDLSLIHI